MKLLFKPNLSNPKWLIIQQILTIDSKRSKKITSRLKIQDISIFIDLKNIPEVVSIVDYKY